VWKGRWSIHPWVSVGVRDKCQARRGFLTYWLLLRSQAELLWFFRYRIVSWRVPMENRMGSGQGGVGRRVEWVHSPPLLCHPPPTPHSEPPPRCPQPTQRQKTGPRMTKPLPAPQPGRTRRRDEQGRSGIRATASKRASALRLVVLDWGNTCGEGRAHVPCERTLAQDR